MKNFNDFQMRRSNAEIPLLFWHAVVSINQRNLQNSQVRKFASWVHKQNWNEEKSSLSRNLSKTAEISFGRGWRGIKEARKQLRAFIHSKAVCPLERFSYLVEVIEKRSGSNEVRADVRANLNFKRVWLWWRFRHIKGLTCENLFAAFKWLWKKKKR